jgi:hypothetical protein
MPADTANNDARVVGAVIRSQHYVRYVFADLINSDNTVDLHLLGRHCRNRHWLVQQSLRSPTGGHGDFVHQNLG